MAKPKSTPSRKMGRPSDYTPEIGLAICERLAGGESLSAICADESMPHRATVHRWLFVQPGFAAAYAHARELQCELIAETALTEALSATPATAQAARVHFDARKWFVSKVAPRKWGDKVINEHSGPDGSPVQIAPAPPPLVAKEIAAAVRDLLGKAEAAAGLPPGSGSDAERLRAIVESGKPLTPDLYEILHADRSNAS